MEEENMLRFLTIIIISIFLTGASNSFREPTKYEILKQNKMMTDSLLKAEQIYQKTEFRTEVKIKDFKTDLNYKDYMDNVFADSKKMTQKNKLNLYVCISLEQPDSYLRSIINEAGKIHAQVVIRGFYKNFKTTYKRIKNLSNEFGIAINPLLFSKHNIQSVPTFILEDENNLVIAKGSTSFRYFLDLVERSGNEKEKKIANVFLQRYRVKI